MIIGTLRRVAFVVFLLVVALAGRGVSSLTQPANAPGVVHASAFVAPTQRDSNTATDPRNSDPAPVVPLARPVRLQIPSLGIDATVEALGVDGSGVMETPHNIWNVGWYQGGPSPGDAGDAVIDGHVGLPGSPLVFSGLTRLATGADVIAVLADGTRSRFTVSSLQNWPSASQPPGLFSADGQPRLSLITCTGKYDRRSQSYADRLIVQTTYAGAA